MNYINIHNTVTTIYKTGDILTYEGYERYISVLCKEYFIDMKFYNKCIAKKLDIKRGIPLRLSNKIMLFKVSKDEEYFINYYNIIYIGEMTNNIFILFKDGSYLEIKENINKMKRNIEKCKKIDEYLNDNDNFRYN